MSRVIAFLSFVCLIVCVSAGSIQAASLSRTQDERPWPRQYNVNGTKFSVYRPELDSWANNQLQCRAVMAVTAVVSKPIAVPEMMFVAGPVLDASAMSRTGRDEPAV